MYKKATENFFEEFDKIIEKKEVKTQQKKEETKLSKKRLGRATGSNYDKISFKEQKHYQGSTPKKKDELIGFLLSSKQGKALLDAEILKQQKESAEKLTNDSLKQLVAQTQGEFILGDTGHTYMRALLAQLMTGQFSERTSSASLRWGLDNEPEALEAYQEQELAKNKNLLFHDNQFVINKYNKATGSTPDLIVYELDIDVEEFKELNSEIMSPIVQSRINSDIQLDLNVVSSSFKFPEFMKKFGSIARVRNVVENKCPYVTANHIKTLMNHEVDERYIKQVFGHILNTLSHGCQWCDFTSYDKRIIDHQKKLVTVRVSAQEHAQELEALERDLFNFTGLYKEQAKKLGINLESKLK